MRQIKASEVKPGMEVHWKSQGFTHKGTVERITSGNSAYVTRFINGSFSMNVPSDATVTVLHEPQPEEPTEFGARVVVDGRRFLRAHEWEPVLEDEPWLEKGKGKWFGWDDLCEMGQVQVIPDQGWTVPTDAPEVPERITEWPEDDTALRKHKWRDLDGRVWLYADDGWQQGNGWAIPDQGWTVPTDAPWERETDAGASTHGSGGLILWDGE